MVQEDQSNEQNPKECSKKKKACKNASMSCSKNNVLDDQIKLPNISNRKQNR